jgi:NAD(P)-dependent dehydrogenase (short-subunit alcohol dehydrogenase family)
MTHHNKIAVVTGSSRGLGKNTALKLAQNGADLVITYRKKRAEGEKVLGDIHSMGRKAILLQLDVADRDSRDAFAGELKAQLQGHWGRDTFDFLVNNAGIDRSKAFAEFSESDFDELMNTHFKGVFFLTQRLLPLLADNGRIVNTSTGLARFSIPGYAAYASMKGAIEVLTRYLAKELGSRGITANCIAPGATETDFTREFLSHQGAVEHLAANTALGRVGQPDDIGAVVDFLCSDAARWVTAQRLEASGGLFL